MIKAYAKGGNKFILVCRYFYQDGKKDIPGERNFNSHRIQIFFKKNSCFLIMEIISINNFSHFNIYFII